MTLGICAVIFFGMIVWGLLRPDRIYQYPFVAGAVFAGFVFPQLIGLSNNPNLPVGALDKTIFMSALCGIMCFIGHACAEAPLKTWAWHFDERKLLIAASVLVAVGGYFFYKISRLPQELTNVGGWTGLPVAYRFFASVLSYGFVIAVLIYFRSWSRHALVIAIVGAAFYADRIFIAGRRGTLLEFSFIIAMALLFQRGVRIPRWIMIVGLICGALLANSIGQYRSLIWKSEERQWKEVAKIDFVGNYRQLIANGGPELTNAVYNIHVTSLRGDYDLGLYHWNLLVFNYVPAQLVGHEFKRSLAFKLDPPALHEFSYVPPYGSTATGMSDAFKSFWYFGCLKFFLIAMIMGKIFLAATRGHTVAQLIYMLMITPALLAITHQTQAFFSPWVHMALFLLPALMYARIPSRASFAQLHPLANPLSRPR
jgi:hypothetical protein